MTTVLCIPTSMLRPYKGALVCRESKTSIQSIKFTIRLLRSSSCNVHTSFRHTA
jgi:hypothetical protein